MSQQVKVETNGTARGSTATVDGRRVPTELIDAASCSVRTLHNGARIITATVWVRPCPKKERADAEAIGVVEETAAEVRS